MNSRTARRLTAAVTAALALAVGAADAAADPDLVVSRVSYQPVGTADGVVGAGATLRVAERTRNAGTSFARKSTTRYFVDDQPLRSLGRRTVQTLAPGESTAILEEFALPATVSPGTYRVLACADGEERVRERSERNNCRTASRSLRVRANQRDAVFIGGGAATGAVIGAVEGVPTLLAPELTITDPDDTRLTGATVRIVGGGLGASAIRSDLDYSLTASPPQGITGTYNSGTGVLTLRGVAPIASYQRALRTVWYTHLGDNPQGSRKAELRARDAVGVWSRPVRRNMTVTPVNDPPTLAFAGPPSSKQAIGSSIALLDPDSEIAGATVRVTTWEGSQVDVSVTNQLGITGTYNSGTGVLTLTGTTSAENYETVLRTVGYRNISASGPGGFEFRVTDAAGATSNILPYVEQQP